MREIEVKLKVNNLSELEKALAESGCMLSEPIFQHDVEYSYKGLNNEFKGFKEGDIMFRIRYTKDSAILTLKKQKSNEMDNLEYETVLGNPKDMHEILLALDYQSSVEVKKMRRKGKLGEYEICLDEVERLGNFVELEKLTNDDDDHELVTEDLLQKLEQLGLSRKDQEFKGYDTQIFELDNK
jgi:adenylate cyclase class 2